MRIISKKTLKEFYGQSVYIECKSSVEAWHREVLSADWNNSNEIKNQYRSASIIGDNRVVFNIQGNKYRLIVQINYYAKIVYVRFIGTHKEYDKINAREI
jgi:mRNA interferase HigB